MQREGRAPYTLYEVCMAKFSFASMAWEQGDLFYLSNVDLLITVHKPDQV